MAKRTYEQSLTFFKRNTKSRGEGRELYKTPIPIIEKIVDSLIVKYPDLKNRIWIDPCAGDGRWEEIIKSKGILCKSFDIQPLISSVVKMDFYEMNPIQNSFIIGNPPFSQLKNFINKALTITDKCYFLGGSQIITGTLSNKVDVLHRFEGYEGNQRDKRSKILFEDTNNKLVPVWCCGALFDNEEHNNFTHFDYISDNTFGTSVKKHCLADERVINIVK